jgi:hypothetical protein
MRISFFDTPSLQPAADASRTHTTEHYSTMTAMRWRLGALLLSTVCVHAFVVPSCPKRAFSVRNGPLSTKLHPDSDAPHKGRKRD